MIRTSPKVYGFLWFLKNQDTLSLNNFLLIPVELVIFSTVSSSFIPFNFIAFDRSHMVIWSRFQCTVEITKVWCWTAIAANFINVSFFCSVVTQWLSSQNNWHNVLPIQNVDLILHDLSILYKLYTL